MQKVRELFNPTVVLSMVILTCLGLLMIGHKDFGMDELDSIFITSSWSNLLEVIWYREGNMWLYYILLYGWEVLGRSEAVVRGLSVLFGVATLPLAYQLAKMLFNDRVARLATVMVAVDAFVVFNAQNARAYTLVLFLTTLAGLGFARYVLRGGRGYLALAAICNVLAVYSHLYAAFVVAAQFASLALVWRRTAWREVMVAFGLTGLAVLPLVLAPSFHAQPIDWIPAPSLKSLAGTLVVLSDDFIPLAGVYLALLSVYGVHLWRSRARWWHTVTAWKIGFTVLWVILPVVLALAVSLVAKPMYTSTYFFICVLPFTLLVAAALLQMVRQVRWRTVVLGTIALLAAVRLYGWYSGSPVLAGAVVNTTENWSGTAQYLSANVKRGDGVLYYPSMARDKVGYYMTKQGGGALGHQVILKPYFLTTGVQVTDWDNSTLESLPETYPRVWFVAQRVIDKQTIAETAEIQRFLDANYRQISVEKRGFLEVYEYAK